MATRESLREELLSLVETHKEGFASGSPAAQRIDELIDEIAPHTKYPHAIDHPEIYGGNWQAVYHSMGRLVGGKEATNQGVGVTATLRTFSLGRMPEIPAQFLGNGLEIDPKTGAYNFTSQFAVGTKKVRSHMFAIASYRRREENLDRFFVEFAGLSLVPADPDMSLDAYAREIGLEDPAQLTCEITPRIHMWSHVAYMDDDLRIQLGQQGGHYVMRKTNLPMYSIEYFRDESIRPSFASAESYLS